MATESKTDLTNELVELLLSKPGDPKMTGKGSVLDGIARLKAKLNAPILDIHETDCDHDPAKLQQLVRVLGDIAVHGHMFRRDPRDDHERNPGEVRDLVTALCRKRGTGAVMDMVLDWKGFRLHSLPQETKDALSQALDLAADFWKTKG